MQSEQYSAIGLINMIISLLRAVKLNPTLIASLPAISKGYQ